MRNENFEWDDIKATANIVKHGVDFVAASRVFDDAFALDRPDEGNTSLEARMSIIGNVAGTCLYVIYTERGARVRIISARKANRHEQREYYYGQIAE
jgi:uncharacterized DUF497 family protein